MIRNRWKKKSSAALCVAVAISLLTACSDGESTAGTKEGDAFASDAPYELSFSTTLEGEPPAPGNEVEQLIEKATHVKLSMQWIALAAGKDKTNLMITSGDMPKAMAVDLDPPIVNAMKSETFWELTPYIGNYPNLTKINKVFYDNINVNGKLYGLPKSRNITRDATVYRKDWMDALGLKEPQSLEEEYNLIKAFTLSDPDKNGKADTIGYAVQKELSGFDKRVVMHGGPNMWGEENGKLMPSHLTAAYMDVLKWYKRLYDEKLMNLDFAVTQKAQLDKTWASGKLGIWDGVVLAGVAAEQNVQKAVPTAQVWLYGPYAGPKGKRMPGASFTDKLVVIPKATVKTVAELKRILSFFDKMTDTEMATLMNSGIEGKHYKVENNKLAATDEEDFRKVIKPYRDGVSRDYVIKAKPTLDKPLVELGNKMALENESFAVYNLALSLNSQTFTEKGGELDTIIKDARVKYIMGQIDDAGWQKEIEKWRKAGGDKMIEEYNVEYAAANKK